MKPIDCFMSLLGYVPRPAKYADSLLSLKIDIDSTSVDSALAKVERLSAAAEKAEVAVLHAGIIAPPAAQFATAELVTDESQPLILAELRKHTTLLEVLAKQGDIAATEQFFATSPAKQHAAAPAPSTGSRAARAATLAAFAKFAPAVTAAAEARFAADPFAPTFELDAGEDAVRVTLYPRAGSVQYLVNVTGPHSAAVKFEAGVPRLVQVSRVEESLP
jgi:hypothetical protein